MKSKEFDENGNLIEVQENGKTVLNLQEVRETVEQSNGNPDMKEAMLKIVDYLEREG